MDERLESVIAAQDGVLRTGQAEALGLGTKHLARLVAADALIRVRRDAYVLADPWRAATPEARLALTTRAVLLDRPDCYASHQAALSLHGVPLHGVSLGVVDALAPVSRVRTASGLRRHPILPALASHLGRFADLSAAAGCGCVSLACALAQMLVRGPAVAAIVAVDFALHARLVDEAGIRAALALLSLPPRLAVRAQTWLTGTDARSESVGETRTRLRLVDGGHQVESQVEIYDDDGLFVARVDHLVAGRAVIEFDGAVKYAAAEGREALVAEKRREDRIRALGYGVGRVVWPDLGTADRVARIAACALEAAAPLDRIRGSTRRGSPRSLR